MDELEQMLQKIEAMKNTDLRKINPDSLVDINDVTYNEKLPRNERLLDFVQQIGNPYCYKRGKLIIKASYDEHGATLEDRLENFLLSL